MHCVLSKRAHDIFAKPVNIDELRQVLQRIYRRIEIERESLDEHALANRVLFENMIGVQPDDENRLFQRFKGRRN